MPNVLQKGFRRISKRSTESIPKRIAKKDSKTATEKNSKEIITGAEKFPWEFSLNILKKNVGKILKRVSERIPKAIFQKKLNKKSGKNLKEICKEIFKIAKKHRVKFSKGSRVATERELPMKFPK